MAAKYPGVATLNEQRGSSPGAGVGWPTIRTTPWMSMLDAMKGIAATAPTASIPGSVDSRAITRSK